MAVTIKVEDRHQVLDIEVMPSEAEAFWNEFPCLTHASRHVFRKCRVDTDALRTARGGAIPQSTEVTQTGSRWWNFRTAESDD